MQENRLGSVCASSSQRTGKDYEIDDTNASFWRIMTRSSCFSFLSYTRNARVVREFQGVEASKRTMYLSSLRFFLLVIFVVD
jgi:hypothetical protein